MKIGIEKLLFFFRASSEQDNVKDSDHDNEGMDVDVNGSDSGNQGKT